MRHVQQHRGVLEATGFALTGVDDDGAASVARPGGPGDGTELAGEGEARAAAAPQVDALGELHEVFETVPGQVAVDGEVGGAIEPRHDVESRQQSGHAHTAECRARQIGHCRPRLPSKGPPGLSVVTWA